MAEVRFGHVEGPGQGREYPVAATQYFARRGGKFVTISSGNVSLAASGTVLVLGWAETPKDTAGANSWVSSSTAGADKVFVIYGTDDVYEMRYNTGGAALSTSIIGAGLGIVNATIDTVAGANRTAAAGTAQMAKYGTTASPLTCVDVNTTDGTVLVKIKATKKQAS